MLLREISKIDSLPLSAEVKSIHSFPIHMHDAYEILFVLDGTIELKCTAFNYTLSKGDIFIVNVKELHKLSNGSPSNLILILQFDPYRYLSIFPKLDYYIFICDSFDSTNKHNEKLIHLQQLLLKIYYQLIHRSENANVKAEEYLFELITYLINHFQSFRLEHNGYRNNSVFKGTAYQQERIFNIQEYLYRNFNRKIDLEDVADYVHLSKYYVSHIIKTATGLSMTEFLGLTRVERSEHLLLSTSKAIEDIAFECGFSALRYYEKHFFRWYNMRPSDYRKNYIDAVEPSPSKECTYSINPTALAEALKTFAFTDVQTSASVPYPGVYQYALDFRAPFQPFAHSWNKGLRISDTFSCLHLIPVSVIVDTQKDLNFTSVELCGIFENYRTEKAMNPYLFKDLIRFIESLMLIGLNVAIVIDPYLGDSHEIIDRVQRFLFESKQQLGLNMVEKWSLYIKNPTKKIGFSKKYALLFDLLKDTISAQYPKLHIQQISRSNNPEKYMYNSMHLVSEIIDQALHPQEQSTALCQELCDIPAGMNEGRVSFDSNNYGLFSEVCEKKPVYHAWHFLSLLGEERSLLAENIVITRKGENMYVLIYDSRKDATAESKKNNLSDITVALRFVNLNEDSYTITKLELFEEISLFEHFVNRGYAISLSSEELKYVNMASSPRISFSIAQKGFSDNMLIDIKPYGAVLLIFTKK